VTGSVDIRREGIVTTTNNNNNNGGTGTVLAAAAESLTDLDRSEFGIYLKGEYTASYSAGR